MTDIPPFGNVAHPSMALHSAAGFGQVAERERSERIEEEMTAKLQMFVP